MSTMYRMLWIVITIVLLIGLDGAAHATVPGIGRLFSQLGKAGARKAIGNTAGKATAKAAAKALTSAGNTVTREAVEKALARSAPRSILKEITPGHIIAGGAAVGIVITADGAADAMCGIASPTGDSLGKAIDGTASSSARVIGEIRGFLDGVASNFLFYTSVLFFCTAFTLFWRFSLMPWHRKTDTTETAPAGGGKSAGHGSPPTADISDAEVVKARRPERS